MSRKRHSDASYRAYELEFDEDARYAQSVFYAETHPGERVPPPRPRTGRYKSRAAWKAEGPFETDCTTAVHDLDCVLNTCMLSSLPETCPHTLKRILDYRHRRAYDGRRGRMLLSEAEAAHIIDVLRVVPEIATEKNLLAFAEALPLLEDSVEAQYMAEEIVNDYYAGRAELGITVATLADPVLRSAFVLASKRLGLGLGD